MSSAGGDQGQLLHGTLYVTISGAHQLQRKSDESLKQTLLKFGFGAANVAVRVLTKEWTGQERSLGQDGLFATVDLGNATVAQTKCVSDSTNPNWNEVFRIYCAHSVSHIAFTIKEDNIWAEQSIAGQIWDKVIVKTIGKAYVPVAQLTTNRQEIETRIKILDEGRNQIKDGSYLHVKILFVSALQESLWFPIIGSPEFSAVPYSFYPERGDCRVTLYQDAHVPDDFNPKLVMSLGREEHYQTNRCWEDMYDSISKAKQLIYIAGWAFDPKVRLVREGGNSDEIPNIGELLLKKANEGVKVCLLIWENSTAYKVLFSEGAVKDVSYLIQTNAFETENFFKGTPVQCKLCLRSFAHNKLLDTSLSKLLYSHHQKIVVVDNEVPWGGTQERRIVSYIGGLDFFTGRYDTPKHSLFRTLDTVHKDDFHQTCFLEASREQGGPRLPWHDIHCKIEGPAAWDVMHTFEQRWALEVGNINLLLPNDPNLIGDPSPVMPPMNMESWNVQVFRSMDNGAASGYPTDLVEMCSRGLVSRKGVIIEQSIQDAYVNAIRRAKNFIYIENQFFLGSSFDWKGDLSGVEALHIIPKEILLKTVSKIKANERFSVYVLIPMWSEGSAGSFFVRTMLDWQWRTMEMMYANIALALQETGIQANPRDYLSFFCLGNREVDQDSDFWPPNKPPSNTHYSKAQSTRRFMIYVHSKIMIVDDEYIIVGSANINQRSMDGARDTEIAMGAYQPYYIDDGQRQEWGKVRDFRMSLWYEHIGELKNSFKYPQSLGCMRQVNEVADRNWDLFASKKFDQDLPSHLLRYPIQVHDNGVISTLPETEFFPDTQTRIKSVDSSHATWIFPSFTA